jgi:hypothetical protein
MADVAHGRQVVRDEEVREAEAASRAPSAGRMISRSSPE